MNKLRVILRLLFSKEYHLIIIERDKYNLIEHIYSSTRRTETTYKKLLKLLKEELEEIRRYNKI